MATKKTSTVNTRKSTTSKTRSKAAAAPEKKVVLQYLGKEFDEADLTERAVAQFHSVEGTVAVETITMYLKPEEDAAYYVINDQYTGRVDF